MFEIYIYYMQYRPLTREVVRLKITYTRQTDRHFIDRKEKSLQTYLS